MQLSVVLVRPLYAGNVGSSLRAAANFGAAELVLVQARAHLDEPDFRRMAMGAGQHVPVREVDSVEDAVRGADVVVGTSSVRSRDPRGVHGPAELAERLAGSSAERVALLFGPEQSGLTHEELARCHLTLSIPTHERFAVLNLSHAVAVVLSFLSASEQAVPDRDDPLDEVAPALELQAGLDHLAEALEATGFLDPHNPARVMDQLRRLVGRAVPTRREVAILRGIASHIAYIWGRSSGDG